MWTAMMGSVGMFSAFLGQQRVAPFSSGSLKRGRWHLQEADVGDAAALYVLRSGIFMCRALRLSATQLCAFAAADLQLKLR